MVRVNGSVLSILFVSSSLFLMACAPSNGSSSGGGSSVQATSKSIYAGTWVKPCVAAGANSSGRQKLIVTDTTVEIVSENFATAGCSGGSLVDAIASADYVMRPDVSLPSDVKAMDLTVRKLVMVSRNSLVTAKLNTDAFCGFTDWETNREKDMIGTSCAGTADIAAGTVSYTSIRLVNNMLYLAKTNGPDSGKSEATRETEAETTGFMKE